MLLKHVRVACPEVPAGWQLWPTMPMFCGAQVAPTETLAGLAFEEWLDRQQLRRPVRAAIQY